MPHLARTEPAAAERSREAEALGVAAAVLSNAHRGELVFPPEE